MTNDHIPVLVNEVITFFHDKKMSVFYDGTLGAGGHAHTLLQKHKEITLYIGVDRDENALAIARKTLKEWKDKVCFIQGSFADIKNFLQQIKQKGVDGILLDVGVSSMQIDTKERGFSFKEEAILDMRMDLSASLTAKEVINEAPLKELEMIFRDLAEERNWRKLAKAIVDKRKRGAINTTKELIEVVLPYVQRKKKIHPATLVFQGLRIYVNDELKQLEKVIVDGIDCLNKKQRMGIITFHSLEDRIVKNLFRDAAREKKVTLLTKKPVVATREEVRKNIRSRSAKLRFIEKN